MRIGLGLDVHAFDPSRPLVLGGVTIDGAPGLAGWSDADVLCHAVTDAVLGAAGLGDMGRHFSEEAVPEGVSSLELLGRTAQMVAKLDLRPESIDSVVAAQEVRLAPFVARMQEEIAAALGIDPSVVGVKATTTDRLGFTGRGEGIAAMAVALLAPVGKE